MSEQTISQGSYLIPRVEHARVADAMRHGILTCAQDAPLRAAARTMTMHHVHTVVVTGPDSGDAWGVVSDGDLVRALCEPGCNEHRLGDIATRDVQAVLSDQPLGEAMALMRERAINHLVVLDATSRRPTGMLSSLDVLGILGWGEG